MQMIRLFCIIKFFGEKVPGKPLNAQLSILSFVKLAHK